ncbi:hypothetical protein AB0M42_28510 [Streptomyces sp. NPDC051784]|uniref:hypothetical protein n=1 Tax=Streptomyces sp. NPDC051784 TaxID=3155805 RepID=UPI00342CFFC1
MLLSSWVALTAVERWAEHSPWPSAMLGGLLWSSVVAGVWWFAEWTQSPLRTARKSDSAGASEAPATNRPGTSTGAGKESHDGVEDPAPSRAGSSTPSHH